MYKISYGRLGASAYRLTQPSLKSQVTAMMPIGMHPMSEIVNHAG